MALADGVQYNGGVVARFIGRYQVVRILGTGGFATVYLARDDILDTDVAIKVLAENWAANEDITRRFEEEARLLRLCDDDRVVRVHTIERLDDGRPYFVMELADGGTLADQMAARREQARPFTVEEATALASSIAEGLTVVHDRGIVHRDLKPSNVLFRRGRVVLGDFGLAREMVLAGGQTIHAGTPAYMAPEQADPTRAGAVDERADVYAAAVVLYEMLAGRPPFGHTSVDQAAQLRQSPPPLDRIRPDVAPALSGAVARGMAWDPDDRYPTGRAWQRALAAPIHAIDPPTLAMPAAAELPGTVAMPPPLTEVAATAPAVGPAVRRGWLLPAALLAVVAIAVAAALLVGNGGGSPRTTASGLPTTVAPSTTATTTVTLATAGGVATWFAAASGPSCAPAATGGPVVGAVACTASGIDAVFRQMSSPAAADAFLADLASLHPDATHGAWANGNLLAYPGTGGTVLVWTYTGTPYVGQATGQQARVSQWWAATGRVAPGTPPATVVPATTAPRPKGHGKNNGNGGD